MKFQTVVALVCLAVVLILIGPLFLAEGNREIFRQQVDLIGYQVSVARLGALAMTAAMLLPAFYFTVLFWRMRRDMSATRRASRGWDAGRRELEQARALFHHGCYDRVEKMLTGTRDPDGRMLLARALLIMERRSESLDILAALFEETGRPEVGYLLISAGEGEPGRAIPILEKMIEADPENARKARRQLLELREGQGDWQACIDLAGQMERAGDDMPRHMAAYRLELVRSAEENKKTADLYGKIVRKHPNFLPAWLAQADALLRAGTESKAVAVVEKAWKQTENPAALEFLERYYLEQGRPDEALALYRKQQSSATVALFLARLFFRLEMHDDVLETLEPYENVLGEAAEVRLLLSRSRARRNRYDEAFADLEAILNTRACRGEPYHCSHCGAAHEQWRDRCSKCRRWNTIGVSEHLHVEPTAVAPVY